MSKKKQAKKELSGTYRVVVPADVEQKYLYCCPALDARHSNLLLYNNEIINVIKVEKRDADGAPLMYYVTNSYGEEYYMGSGYTDYLEPVLITMKRRRI